MALTESVAVIVSIYPVFATVVAATVTTPVLVSMEMPGIYGNIDHFFVPVPLLATKAVEVSSKPRVVTIVDCPPLITIDGLTVIRMVVVAMAPTESVAVMVSRYVVKTVGLPMDPVTETTPVLVSIVMPASGVMDQCLVPVPRVAVNAVEVSGMP